MSHNVGGIHVRANRLTIERVTKAIAAYFVERGARRQDRGARALEPLGYEESGKLGIAIAPARDGWFAVMDSEAYSASEGLAQYLATTLEREVVFWEVNGASDSASLVRYGDDGEVVAIEEGDEPGELETPGGVEDYLHDQGLPYALVRFQDLVAAPAKEKRGVTWMGFAGVTGAAYHGGDEEKEEEDDEEEGDEEETSSDDAIEDRRYRDAAEAVFRDLMTVPGVSPRMRELAFSAVVDRRDDALFAYPRHELSTLWDKLIRPRWCGWPAFGNPPDPARGVPLLREHLGWIDGDPPVAVAANDTTSWLILATGLVAIGERDRAAAALRVALGSEPSTDRWSEAAEILKQLGDKAAAKEAVAIAERKKPSVGQRVAASTWAAAPLAVVDGRGLDAHRALAEQLGVSESVAAIEAEVSRRKKVLASTLAEIDVGALGRRLIELGPVDRTASDVLLEHARAVRVKQPAIALAIARHVGDYAALPIVLEVELDGGPRATDGEIALATRLASRWTDIGEQLARIRARRGEFDEAMRLVRLLKSAATPRLAALRSVAELESLWARPDAAALFDEPVLHRDCGIVLTAEVEVVMLYWALPMAKAGPHLARVFERYVERFGSQLKFGNTSVNKAGYSPMDKAMLGRARGAMTGAAATKPLVAFELRDTDRGAFGHAIAAIGSQEKGERTALWFSAPPGGFGDGDALVRELIEVATVAGPLDCGHADVALSFVMNGVNSYKNDHYMFLVLHPGLDLPPGDVAMRTHDAGGVVGARFAVVVGEKMAKQLPATLPSTIERGVGGTCVVLRAGDRPARGTCLRDEPWFAARRDLARALEPFTNFDVTPYGMDGWSRRWLAG